MPLFKQADGTIKLKPDKKGLIVIRIDRQSEGVNPATNVMPAQGNLREIVLVEESTVGEVSAAIRTALFSDE